MLFLDLRIFSSCYFDPLCLSAPSDSLMGFSVWSDLSDLSPVPRGAAPSGPLVFLLCHSLSCSSPSPEAVFGTPVFVTHAFCFLDLVPFAGWSTFSPSFCLSRDSPAQPGGSNSGGRLLTVGEAVSPRWSGGQCGSPGGLSSWLADRCLLTVLTGQSSASEPVVASTP